MIHPTRNTHGTQSFSRHQWPLQLRVPSTLQAVKAACTGPNSDRITVLPLDVSASEEVLMRFARAADSLHGGLHYAFLAAGARSCM